MKGKREFNFEMKGSLIRMNTKKGISIQIRIEFEYCRNSIVSWTGIELELSLNSIELELNLN